MAVPHYMTVDQHLEMQARCIFFRNELVAFSYCALYILVLSVRYSYVKGLQTG